MSLHINTHSFTCTYITTRLLASSALLTQLNSSLGDLAEGKKVERSTLHLLEEEEEDETSGDDGTQRRAIPPMPGEADSDDETVNSLNIVVKRVNENTNDSMFELKLETKNSSNASVVLSTERRWSLSRSGSSNTTLAQELDDQGEGFADTLLSQDLDMHNSLVNHRERLKESAKNAAIALGQTQRTITDFAEAAEADAERIMRFKENAIRKFVQNKKASTQTKLKEKIMRAILNEQTRMLTAKIDKVEAMRREVREKEEQELADKTSAVDQARKEKEWEDRRLQIEEETMLQRLQLSESVGTERGEDFQKRAQSYERLRKSAKRGLMYVRLEQGLGFDESSTRSNCRFAVSLYYKARSLGREVKHSPFLKGLTADGTLPLGQEYTFELDNADLQSIGIHLESPTRSQLAFEHRLRNQENMGIFNSRLSQRAKDISSAEAEGGVEVRVDEVRQSPDGMLEGHWSLDNDHRRKILHIRFQLFPLIGIGFRKLFIGENKKPKPLFEIVAMGQEKLHAALLDDLPPGYDCSQNETDSESESEESEASSGSAIDSDTSEDEEDLEQNVPPLPPQVEEEVLEVLEKDQEHPSGPHDVQADYFAPLAPTPRGKTEGPDNFSTVTDGEIEEESNAEISASDHEEDQEQIVEEVPEVLQGTS